MIFYNCFRRTDAANRANIRSLCRILTPCLFLFIVTASEIARPKPAVAAEEIRLLVGGPITLSVSVASLETFAQTGGVAEDMRLFARVANEEALAGFRQALQSNFPLTVQQIDNLGYSDLGQDILFDVGKVIRPHPSLNGDHALRGAVIKAAANTRENGQPAEWTVLDVLKQYPSQTIDLRLQDLQAIRRFITSYLNDKDQIIATIRAHAAIQSSQEANPVALSEDLSAPGSYAFETGTVTLSREDQRQTSQGVQPRYSFDVDTYIPQGLSAPAPVVIVSHGYSDSKENFHYIGRHLASHGFVVLLPNHVGSNLEFRLSYTEGQLDTAMNPSEYISRPEEISYLIDWLEARVASSPVWAE
ncbi:alpha/beta hydrolase [cf. Phormidesmis sp. LEGE 11477]|uniref:alpha/beta hydrolase n=1 Tax=cf. Phormidesmis sp. LEGE 11477 TaxID=1828680 RepID=UPI00187FA581|nr:alpha/beta hydrolase [cf. Phormidesmis sp. LEGE 11477]MBE9060392.1 alpha/beta hydrolase [cf. Phormidesmis sp. LEGE 11477]